MVLQELNEEEEENTGLGIVSNRIVDLSFHDKWHIEDVGGGKFKTKKWKSGILSHFKWTSCNILFYLLIGRPERESASPFYNGSASVVVVAFLLLLRVITQIVRVKYLLQSNCTSSSDLYTQCSPFWSMFWSASSHHERRRRRRREVGGSGNNWPFTKLIHTHV